MLVINTLRRRHAIMLEQNKLIELMNDEDCGIMWKLARFTYRRIIHSMVSRSD